jgi:hypothetical protein
MDIYGLSQQSVIYKNPPHRERKVPDGWVKFRGLQAASGEEGEGMKIGHEEQKE